MKATYKFKIVKPIVDGKYTGLSGLRNAIFLPVLVRERILILMIGALKHLTSLMILASLVQLLHQQIQTMVAMRKKLELVMMLCA